MSVRLNIGKLANLLDAGKRALQLSPDKIVTNIASESIKYMAYDIHNLPSDPDIFIVGIDRVGSSKKVGR